MPVPVNLGLAVCLDVLCVATLPLGLNTVIGAVQYIVGLALAFGGSRGDATELEGADCSRLHIVIGGGSDGSVGLSFPNGLLRLRCCGCCCAAAVAAAAAAAAVAAAAAAAAVVVAAAPAAADVDILFF